MANHGAEVSADSVGSEVATSSEATVLVKFAHLLLIVLVLAALAWAADLYRAVGMLFMNEQYYAGILALGLPALFLLVPANGHQASARRSPPWYDVVIAVVMALTSIFIMVRYEAIIYNFQGAEVSTIAAALLLLLGILEGLRRTAGTFLFALLLVFVLYAFFGYLLPGSLQGQRVTFERLVPYLTLDANGIFGVPMQVATTVIVAFMFFGFVLEPAGGGKFFTDLAMSMMGRYRGGSSKIAVLASSLFGSISGSAVSNVVATGSVTIPLMRRGGYSASSAAAIEAVASTGGQLMPPLMGVAAFLMAEFIQVDYTSIVYAAIIPSVLYFAALFCVVDQQAARDKISGIDKALIPSGSKTLRRGFLNFIPFLFIIVGLFHFNLKPETAALYAALTVIPIGYFFGYGGARLSLKALYTATLSTGRASLEMLMIGGAAGIIMGVLNITGLGFGLTLELVRIAGGMLFPLLLLSALLCIILGMGMPTTGVYILLATLVAPSIVQLGVSPMAAHMFVLYYGMMSMITPPVAIAAFAAATLAKAPLMETAFKAVQFGWSAFLIPFLFVFSPGLIMEGDWVDIAFTFVTALVGVWCVSGAITGYLTRPVTRFMRPIYLLVGLALLLPVDIFSGAHIVNAVAAVGLVALLAAARFADPAVAVEQAK